MLLNLKWRWPRRYGYPPENQEGQQPDWGPTYVSASYQIRANGNDKAKPHRDGGPDGAADFDGARDGDGVANSKTQVQQEAQTSGGHYQFTEKSLRHFDIF